MLANIYAHYQKHSNYLRILFVIPIIITVSIVKSFSIWNYEHSFADEPSVVNYAVGFLGNDFNPTWFGYHTLPMYILYAFYNVIYYFYFAAGYVSTKTEFVSLLFSNDKIFFVTARLVCSTVYTAGIFVLARVLWTKFNSRLSAVIFFIVASIFHDSLEAANYVRVDTFVFLFMALTVYFSCFAEKNRRTFVFSAIFAAAAFCSKSPAIVVPSVLFLKLIADIYRNKYPKKYLLYYLVLVPACAFVFMPYAVLDFADYRPVLGDLINRASGQSIHVGKIFLGGTQERSSYIYEMFREQVGFLSLTGILLYITLSSFRKDTLFPVIYAIAYAIIFTTSRTIDPYWYRPVYPFFIFFTFVAVLLLTSKEHKSFDFIKLNMHKGMSAFVPQIFAVVLGIVYLYSYNNHVQSEFLGAMDTRKDTRLLSGKWINTNIPAKSSIWLDGNYVYYFPKILATDINTDMRLFGVYFPKNNQIINEAFYLYYESRILRNKSYNVQILGLEDDANFPERLKLLRPGDYVITSSEVYDRYFDRKAMKGLEFLAEYARSYYAVLGKQHLVSYFEGKGPTISIFMVKDVSRRQWGN